MSILFYIILSTFLVSLLSFVGALGLFLKNDVLDRLLTVLVAFSAGAMMGGAFLHLIPEALELFPSGEILQLFIYLLSGFTLFFVLEGFIQWHHHHAREHPNIMPFSYLILVSDTLHNFLDGLVMAAAFMSSLNLGFITTLVISFHEIPQEIGDFGILVYGGFRKSKALLFNFLSALSAILGGVIGFLISEKVTGSTVFLLPFAAGNFIYIAASDLIPEIKEHHRNIRKALAHFFAFLVGVFLMWILKSFGLE